MFQPHSYRSPGKLILSGEHAVLYGAPALAMAVACYTETTVQGLPASNKLHLKAPDLQYIASFPWESLNHICQRIRRDYTAFLDGRLSIRAVLKKPIELLQVTVGVLFDRLGLSKPNSGVRVTSCSTIPLGSGMGSSAALIMSTLSSLSHFVGANLSEKTLIQLGIWLESMQHGQSSGLDIHLALKGGALYYQAGDYQSTLIQPDLPLYLVHTGRPASSTGECVAQAKMAFRDTGLLAAFEAITQGLRKAFQQGHLGEIQQGIRDNHRLLQTVGVVPEPVSACIQALESTGAAAKICGAGSVKGAGGGALLVVPSDWVASQAILESFGFQWQKINGDWHGTQKV